MALYEYYCEKCAETVEKIMPFTNQPIQHTCGETMRRLFSLPKIVIKHNGKEMALDMLNSRDTKYMKPGHKEAAAKGLEKLSKTFF